MKHEYAIYNRYKDQVVPALMEEFGYGNIDGLREDADLDALRGDERFGALRQWPCHDARLLVVSAGPPLG